VALFSPTAISETKLTLTNWVVLAIGHCFHKKKWIGISPVYSSLAFAFS